MGFNFTVGYGNNHACVMGNEETLDKAVAAMQYHINYYKELGYPITETTVAQWCDTCNGGGELRCKHKAHNRYSTTFMPERCRKVCETCKGERFFPVELPAQVVV